jgi:ferredoxin
MQVNLLSNAVKFTEKGEVILEATRLESNEKTVTLEFLCRGKLYCLQCLVCSRSRMLERERPLPGLCYDGFSWNVH